MKRAPNKTQHIVVAIDVHTQVKIYCRKHKVSIKTFVGKVLLGHIEKQLIVEAKEENIGARNDRNK